MRDQSHQCSPKLSKNLRQLLKNEDGVALIEFGIIALPFIMLLYMVFEVAFIYYGRSLMNVAMQRAVNLATVGCERTDCTPECFDNTTGELKSGDECFTTGHTIWGFSGVTAAMLADEMYNATSGLIDFKKKALDGTPRGCLMAVTHDRFGNASPAFDMGGAGDMVGYYMNYKWPILGPAQGIQELLGVNDSFLTSPVSMVVRNESYDIKIGTTSVASNLIKRGIDQEAYNLGLGNNSDYPANTYCGVPYN